MWKGQTKSRGGSVSGGSGNASSPDLSRRPNDGGKQQRKAKVYVKIPAGAVPGQVLQVEAPGGPVPFTVPEGAKPGNVFRITAPSLVREP